MSEPPLVALARKYATLGELHRALAAWDDARAAELDRALAREFPGALRELQTLTLDEIEARRRALEAAAAGGAAEPWMVWMGEYHREMRVALRLKRRIGRAAAAPLDDAEVARLVLAMSGAESPAASAASLPAAAADPASASAASSNLAVADHSSPDAAPPAIDAAFVRAVAHPPRGRLGDVVLARIAERHGTDPLTVARALFRRVRAPR